MKKVLLAAMILLAGASFTSCSSSDDDDNEKQEQKFDASKVMSGKWKLSKIQDFPIPINHYSIQKGNTISFLDGGILHRGRILGSNQWGRGQTDDNTVRKLQDMEG